MVFRRLILLVSILDHPSRYVRRPRSMGYILWTDYLTTVVCLLGTSGLLLGYDAIVQLGRLRPDDTVS